MKYKIPVLVASLFLIYITIALVVLNLPNDYVEYHQDIDYSESIEKISNPDQGFYRPIYVKMDENGVTYNKNIITDSTQLYHLRIDISAFSAKTNGNIDSVFTKNSLTGLESLLSLLQEKGKNAIVRFAYDPDYGGQSNMEPDFDIMKEHVRQVCPILNKFKTTITAVEVGMIGPWGEMHSSTIANATHTTPLIDTFLTNTTDLAILVRTPKMIYDYLDITINDIKNYTIKKSSKAWRLGLFNDGYLGSSSDLDTYTQREKEIAFLSNQTSHLPYGGEAVAPSSDLHNIENCLPEMYQIHLNYLNVEWNDKVVDKWKQTFYTSDCGQDEKYFGKTAFTYIENHMGYRFVLRDSTFKYSAKTRKFKVNLKLQNVGFGNLNKTKKAKLLFVNSENKVVLSKSVANFNGQENLSLSTSLNLEKGKYEVYLCLFGETKNGMPTFTLQFANNDIWNADLSANHIGSIELKK